MEEVGVLKSMFWITSTKLCPIPKASRGEKFEADFVESSQACEKAKIPASSDTLDL